MNTTNIFVHDCVDSERLNTLQRLPDTHIEVVECNDEDENWVCPNQLASNTHVLVSCFPPNNIEEMRSLRMLQISSVGYSQLIGLNLIERGVRVANAAGVYDVPIAEWNLAMIINLGRNLRQMIRNQETQTWDAAPRFQHELSGSVVGIWGYGGIGRETARLCKALQMTVHVLTKVGVKPLTNKFCVSGRGDPQGILPDRVYVQGQEPEFLKELDFLVLALPLTPATNGLIGESQLERLPPRAYILNPARGHLIQEQALLRALREKWIAGAALDTHYYYPLPPEHPLWRFPDVILTPHISGSNASPNFKKRFWDIVIENITRFVTDVPLLNELTSTQLRSK